MVTKKTVEEELEFVVKADIHIIVLLGFFSIDTIVAWKYLKVDRFYSMIIVAIFLFFTLFYFMQLLIFKVWVYKDFCYIRGIMPIHKYYYCELTICDKGKDGFFGTNESVVLDSAKRPIIWLSNYYKNYDLFYKKLQSKGSLIRR